jgi:hypothetical protein
MTRIEYGICPRCGGTGITFTDGITSTSTTETCKCCNGNKSVVTAIVEDSFWSDEMVQKYLSTRLGDTYMDMKQFKDLKAVNYYPTQAAAVGFSGVIINAAPPTPKEPVLYKQGDVVYVKTADDNTYPLNKLLDAYRILWGK